MRMGRFVADHLPHLIIVADDNKIGDHVWLKVIDLDTDYSVSGRTEEEGELALEEMIRRLIKHKFLNEKIPTS